MMKVTLKITMAGNDFVHRKGDVIEVSEAQAKRLADAGYIDIDMTVKQSAKRKKKAK